MRLPWNNSIWRMPVHIERRGGPAAEQVRAAAIVNTQPAMPGLAIPPLVVVQVEGERHAIAASDALFELGDPTPDAILVVKPNGDKWWCPRPEFEAQFEPVNPERRA